jgi:hypothetical protein
MLGGVKMPSQKSKGRTFQPPSNVKIPAAVGEYLQ